MTVVSRPTWPPPWREIDVGILPVVSALVSDGFKPWSSCEGHGESNPWVEIAADRSAGATCRSLITWLRSNGVHGVTVSLYWQVNASHVTAPAIYVEWWSRELLREWSEQSPSTRKQPPASTQRAAVPGGSPCRL